MLLSTQSILSCALLSHLLSKHSASLVVPFSTESRTPVGSSSLRSSRLWDILYYDPYVTATYVISVTVYVTTVLESGLFSQSESPARVFEVSHFEVLK